MATDNRMPMPPLAELSPEQRRVADELSSGPRGQVTGPFVPLLRSPELLDRVQRVGAHLRFGDIALTGAVRELAILYVARHWSQGFEWAHHLPIAIAAGVPAEACAILAEGGRPSNLSPDLETAIRVLEELTQHRTVSQQTYDLAVAAYGEDGLIELVTVTGYYTTLAMIMNTAQVPAPEGTDLPALP